MPVEYTNIVNNTTTQSVEKSYLLALSYISSLSSLIKKERSCNSSPEINDEDDESNIKTSKCFSTLIEVLNLNQTIEKWNITFLPGVLRKIDLEKKSKSREDKLKTKTFSNSFDALLNEVKIYLEKNSKDNKSVKLKTSVCTEESDDNIVADFKTVHFNPLNLVDGGFLKVSVQYEQHSSPSAILSPREPVDNINSSQIRRNHHNSSPIPSPSICKRLLQLSKLKISNKSFGDPDSLDQEEKSCSRSSIQSRFSSVSSCSSPKSVLYGSFVGRFEDSMLAGKLSTKPSKPVEFICDIGVISVKKGKSSNNRKSNIKCPPHLVFPFSAYFYDVEPANYNGTPYVGLINLANDIDINYDMSFLSASSLPSASIDPPGSYRIPYKGQIQVMIKNLHKTAVKVFLVPYDLHDMPVSTRTFIRQKIYKENAEKKRTLAYAIHLQFICVGQEVGESIQSTEDGNISPDSLNVKSPPPTRIRKRIYLYKSIRVVFCNRNDDEKVFIVYDTPSSSSSNDMPSNIFGDEDFEKDSHINNQTRYLSFK